MDNLPLAHVNAESGTFSVGVPLGFMEGNTAFLCNHMHFTIQYAPLSEEESQKQHARFVRVGTVLDDDLESMHRIISFVAKPYSIEHEANPQSKCTISNFTGLAQYKPLAADTKTIVWSFGVTWEESDKQWQTHWDVYPNNVKDPEAINWFLIINSTLVLLFLSSIVAVILVCALRRDSARYNHAKVDTEDPHKETGWKLVHQDVVRPPPHAWLLAALVGTGFQQLGMSVIVLVILFLASGISRDAESFVSIWIALCIVLFSMRWVCFLVPFESVEPAKLEGHLSHR